MSAPPTDELTTRLAIEMQRRVGVRVARGEPLARYTTMRVGGPADLFVEAHNAFELRGLVRFARSRELPLFLLGRGSDLVVSDAGIRGLVVLVRAGGWRIGAAADPPLLVAEAGLAMAKAAAETGRAGLSGLEFGLAIPGTVGGALWANAGAHGHEVAGVLVSASVIGAEGSETVRSAAELAFGYRESRFKHVTGAVPEVIVSATFALEPAPPESIAARLDEIRRWRQGHQPLGLPSAGSVFRNPPEGPSAGELIDRAGLKGRRVGGAVVSEKHANFIINDRAGSAADVRRLAGIVRAEVRRRWGVELRHEVVFAGDWSGWEEAADG